MVYVVVRDAAAIETVMRVAPAWAAASECLVLLFLSLWISFFPFS